jgi:hypothetical protein
MSWFNKTPEPTPITDALNRAAGIMGFVPRAHLGITQAWVLQAQLIEELSQRLVALEQRESER